MKCPFPFCHLGADDPHPDGHQTGRPASPFGSLRVIQRFAAPDCRRDLRLPCDLETEHLSTVFAADIFGFGWALCDSCYQEVTNAIRNALLRDAPQRATDPISSRPPAAPEDAVRASRPHSHQRQVRHKPALPSEALPPSPRPASRLYPWPKNPQAHSPDVKGVS